MPCVNLRIAARPCAFIAALRVCARTMAGKGEEGSKCPVPHDKPHPLVPASGPQPADAAKGGCPVAHGSGSDIPFVIPFLFLIIIFDINNISHS